MATKKTRSSGPTESSRARRPPRAAGAAGSAPRTSKARKVSHRGEALRAVALRDAERAVLDRLGENPWGQHAAEELGEDQTLARLVEMGLIRPFYRITEDGDKLLASSRVGVTARVSTGRRATLAAPAASVDDFHVNDVVDVTDRGKTFRGIVAKFDQDLGLVGVSLFMYGDIVVRWYDPGQLTLVRRG
jgi:hypothetical protein